MNRATRLFLLLLALVMGLSVVGAPPAIAAPGPDEPTPEPPATPSAPEAPAPAALDSFIDVPPGTQFADEISWLADRGISTGWTTPAGQEFRPLDLVRRDAMAAFIYRLKGSPDFTPPAVSPFSDVSTDTPFYKEITWFEAEGITTGWRVGALTEFRPLNPVNRDAMAAFFYRLKGSPDFTPPAASPFLDLGPADQFYREITWMNSVGITTGWSVPGGAEFRPVTATKRDAMAAFLYRFAHLPNDEVVIRDRTFAFDEEQARGIVSWDAETGVLVVNRSVPLFDTLRVDDAITTFPTDTVPEPFLARIASISDTPGTRTFATEPLTLSDVVLATPGELTLRGEVVREEFDPVTAEGIRDVTPHDPGARPALDFTRSYSLSASESHPLGGRFSGGGSITAELALTARFDPELVIDRAWNDDLKRAKLTLATTMSATASVTVSGELAGSATPSFPSYRHWVRIWIGWFPLFIHNEYELGADLTLKADLAYEVTPATAKLETVYGFDYRRGQGIDPIGSANASASGGGSNLVENPASPTVSFSGEVVFPRLAITSMLYRAIGGELRIGPVGIAKGTFIPDEGYECSFAVGTRASLAGAYFDLGRFLGGGGIGHKVTPSLTFDRLYELGDIWCSHPELEVEPVEDADRIVTYNPNTACSYVKDVPGYGEFKLVAKWLKPRAKYDLTLKQPRVADVELDPVTSDLVGFLTLDAVQFSDLPSGPWTLVAEREDGEQKVETQVPIARSSCILYEGDPVTGVVTYRSMDGAGVFPNTLAGWEVDGVPFSGPANSKGSYSFPLTGKNQCGGTVYLKDMSTYTYNFPRQAWPLELDCLGGLRASEGGPTTVAVSLVGDPPA